MLIELNVHADSLTLSKNDLQMSLKQSDISLDLKCKTLPYFYTHSYHNWHKLFENTSKIKT